MTDKPNPDDLKALWRDQPLEETPPMTLEFIHARAFQSRVRRRNVIEYAASAVVLVTFGAYTVVLSDTVLRIASGLIIAGVLIVVWQLYRRASARPAPHADALSFHRAELVRQRDALRSAWLWYLMPFAPGLGLFMVGFALIRPDAALPNKLVLPAFGALYVAIWIWNNVRARKRLQGEIDDLDALARD
jgi:hypothetical protein